MSETMKLLEKALLVQNGADWARELGISRTAFSLAKNRGHMSPAIAGAVAEKLGYDAMQWIAVAALESEKDSSCKSRMVRKFGKITLL